MATNRTLQYPQSPWPSPKPNAKRVASNGPAPLAAARGVSAVARDQQLRPAARIHLAPNESAS